MFAIRRNWENRSDVGSLSAPGDYRNKCTVRGRQGTKTALHAKAFQGRESLTFCGMTAATWSGADGYSAPESTPLLNTTQQDVP